MSDALFADRFRVGRLAGEGGMGRVFEAVDTVTGARVALKVCTATGPVAGERFLREGALLAELAHPAIVGHVAHGETADGERYLAMEWLDGQTLSERLEGGPLAPRDAVLLGLRLARALAFLHARGVVHRDVKPSNVFLPAGASGLGGAKLLDFGIARPAPERSRITRTGVVLGTPGYMAPEVLRGEGALDPRGDVFAFGCLLFECLTGRPPYAGEHAVAIFARMMLEPAPAPSASAAGIPPELDRLVARALSRDPEERPASAAALVDALAALPSALSAEVPGPESRAAVSLRRLGTSERRMTTVVVAGVPRPGSAETVASRDEDEPDVEAGLRELGRQRGVRLERLLDGSLLLGFAAEGAATDTAVRAARAALRLHALAPDVPVSVATGAVIVDETGDRAQPSVGDAIELALRSLPARGIATDETTRRLLGSSFALGPAGELLGERAEGQRSRRPLACLGRERELAVLSGLFEEVRADGVARVALLVGAPGIGKSRIREEFLRRVQEEGEPVRVWVGRADPLAQGSPLASLATAIRGAVGIVDGEPAAARRERLVAGLGGVEAAERGRVAEFLAELVGAPFPDEEAPRVAATRADPVVLGDELRRAFEDLARAEAGASPLVVVLEDLQWSDRATVRWIDALLRNVADRPILVLALGRPEVDELFPHAWADRARTRLDVAPLSRRVGERLAREGLGADAGAETVARLVARAAGNPFYLEELVRAERRGDAGLPETVVAMVHARLATLEPAARLVLRAASVFGQTAWTGGIAALLGPAAEAGAWLGALAEEELLERRPRGRFAGEEEWSFRSELVREATYSTLTEADRETGHRQAGRWLEGAGEVDAMALARHFELGGRRELALVHLTRAAEQAVGGNDFESALARVRRGVELGASGEALGALLALAAEARTWLGELEDAAAAAGEAMALFAPGGPRWANAAAQRAYLLSRLGRTEPARALVDEILTAPREEAAAPWIGVALARLGVLFLLRGDRADGDRLLAEVEARAITDPRALGAIATLRAVAASVAERAEEALEHMTASIEHYLGVSDRRRAAIARTNAGYAAMNLGDLELAERHFREATAEAERIGIAVPAFVRESLVRLLVQTARVEEARPLVAAGLAEAERTRDVRAAGVFHAHAARLHLLVGDAAAAEAEATLAVGALGELPALRAWALAELSSAALAGGAKERALAHARLARELQEQVGGTLVEGDARIPLALAEALRANGLEDEARAAGRAALERLLARVERLSPARRARFLDAVPEHRETLALPG